MAARRPGHRGNIPPSMDYSYNYYYWTWTATAIMVYCNVITCQDTSTSFYRRADLADVTFSDPHLLFLQNTSSYGCVERCLYIGNCLTTAVHVRADVCDCYLFGNSVETMTRITQTGSVVYVKDVAANSNCLVRVDILTPADAPKKLLQNTPQITWADARVACQALGGDLAVIDSAVKEEAVVQNSTGYRIWAGYRRTTPDGVFSWVSGGETSFTWKTGHPVYGELCGLIANFQSRVWFKSADCSLSYPSLCDVPVT